MTSLIEGARKLVSRSTDLGARLDGLERAVEAGRGRLPEDLVENAEGVVERASSRLRLSAEHTVVAIAGATGSGKSSTFNALTGLDLSAVGVRRPTTSWASACVWGHQGAPELLEWLGIPARHQVTRDSMLDQPDGHKDLDGVVLLDLPDHDSTEVSHHLEVDRLVRLADMLVWVVDPQKYADAALHDRYLRPQAMHGDIMVVVLNHIDTVAEERRESMVGDVRRLLEADGLSGVPVIPISAREGIGLDDLRTEIRRRVSQKEANRKRFEGDVRAAAQALSESTGTGRAPRLDGARVSEMEDAFAEAAGVPTVVSAVEKSTRMRANRATGWPVVAWFSKLKPDPLKRLHLDLGTSGKELTGTARTSMPAPTQVQRARVDTTVRGVADAVGESMSRPWSSAVRSASTSRLDDLNDRLDATLAATDLGPTGVPVWAGIVRVLQWLLIATAAAGGLWLAGLALMGYLQMPTPETPYAGPMPLPTVLLLGGIVVGLLLALVCRGLVALTARSRARTADRRLRAGIHEVAEELVVAPVNAEIDAYTEVREGLDVALKR